MELPCIDHILGEDHPSLGSTLDSQHFDYVVVTSPEVGALSESALDDTSVTLSRCTFTRPSAVFSLENQ